LRSYGPPWARGVYRKEFRPGPEQGPPTGRFPISAIVTSNPTVPDPAPDPRPPRPSRRRFRESLIPGTPALCSLPGRALLLLAVAYREDDAPDWQVHFVTFRFLAVESSAVAAYHTLATPEGQPVPPEPANLEQATDEGWRHQ